MNSTKENPSEIGTRVSQTRITAGLSLSDAAKKLGFNNYQTLSEIEKGKRKLNADELSSMAKLYKKSLDFFFNPNRLSRLSLYGERQSHPLPVCNPFKMSFILF